MPNRRRYRNRGKRKHQLFQGKVIKLAPVTPTPKPWSQVLQYYYKHPTLKTRRQRKKHPRVISNFFPGWRWVCTPILVETQESSD